MHRQRIAFGLSIALLCWLHFPLRAQDFRQLGGGPQLRIARFHSVWFFTGFDLLDCDNTRNKVGNITKVLRTEFAEIIDGVPRGFAVIPDGTSEDFTISKETKFTGREVLSRLDEFQKRVLAAKGREGEDVLFCYMMCHGKVVNGKPFLNFGKGADIPRSDIVDRLKKIQAATKARLVVLIVDAAAKGDRAAKMPAVPVPPAGVSGSLPSGREDKDARPAKKPSDASAVPDPPAAVSGSLLLGHEGKDARAAKKPSDASAVAVGSAPVGASLFYGHEGFVGLASPRMPGEFGFLGRSGTIFMEAFARSFDLNLFKETKDILDGDGPRRERILAANMKFTELLRHGKKGGVLSWDEFLPHLQEQVDRVYNARVEQLKKLDAQKALDPELQAILKKMTDQKGQHVELFERPRLLTSKRKE